MEGVANNFLWPNGCINFPGCNKTGLTLQFNGVVIYRFSLLLMVSLSIHVEGCHAVGNSTSIRCMFSPYDISETKMWRRIERGENTAINILKNKPDHWFTSPFSFSALGSLQLKCGPLHWTTTTTTTTTSTTTTTTTTTSEPSTSQPEDTLLWFSSDITNSWFSRGPTPDPLTQSGDYNGQLSESLGRYGRLFLILCLIQQKCTENMPSLLCHLFRKFG